VDFQETGRKINVGAAFSQRVRDQIDADSGFLGRNGIIDYSLLVGVHKRERSVTAVRAAAFAREHEAVLRPAMAALTGALGGAGAGGAAGAAGGAGGAAGGAAGKAGAAAGGGAAGAEAGAGGAGRGEFFGKITGSYEEFAKAAYRATPDPDGSYDVEDEIYNLPVGTSCFQLHEGGLNTVSEVEGHAEVGEHVLFLGVIDILIPFGAKKKAEYSYKHAKHGGNDIFSVIPPDAYAARFSKFINENVE
jgi:hypothetical protein